MKCHHICLMFILIFFWLWSLPALIVLTLCMTPAACVATCISITISIYLQWRHRDRIFVNHWFRRWFSHIPWHEWFPCNQLTFETPAVVGVHPHGLLCCGAVAGIHLVPGARTVLAVAPILFYVPVIGWLLRLIGCIPAHASIMRQAVQAGYTLLVVPGGVPEIVLAESGDDRRRFPRHGFLRIATEYQRPVWCVFVKGECSLFQMVKGPALEWRAWLSWKINVPCVMPVFMGWYGTWIPKRRPLTLVTSRVHIHTKAAYKQTLVSLHSI